MSIVILAADDYAMTAGISVGIRALAEARRLSATSAMTTTGRWREDARALAPLRDRLAIGLHFDLTLSAPLGPMPDLAPDGRFPDLATLTKRALLRRLAPAEIAAEAGRQLDAFVAALGHPPDHVDGHQHVHALPVVRDGLIAALHARGWLPRPLVRVPHDRPAAILKRGRATGKALTLALLATGFRDALSRAGLPVNDTFAGVTGFAPGGVAADFQSGCEHAGRLHILMCHPGHVDDDLLRLDPVTDRREAELAHLMADDALSARIWRPDREADGPPVDWTAMLKTSASGDRPC